MTGYHAVTIDELGKGLDGIIGMFIVTDLYYGLRVAHIDPDKSAESTTMALRIVRW